MVASASFCVQTSHRGSSLENDRMIVCNGSMRYSFLFDDEVEMGRILERATSHLYYLDLDWRPALNQCIVLLYYVCRI